MTDRDILTVLKEEIKRKAHKAGHYKELAARVPARYREAVQKIAEDEKEEATLLQWALETDMKLSPEWFDKQRDTVDEESHRVIVWKPFPEKEL